LQEGKIDRSQLTQLASDYFTQEAVDDFASSLKPLGTPTSFKQVATSKRGGMTFRVFVAEFPGRSLRVTAFEEPDGKLEQYMVSTTAS
jgi:D-alanyl-D-alanine carboxypeptidase